MKYWVLDLDDTLVDTNNGLPSALRRALARFDFEASDAEFDRIVDPSKMVRPYVATAIAA